MKLKRKLIAILLAALMLVSMLPLSASAATATGGTITLGTTTTADAALLLGTSSAVTITGTSADMVITLTDNLTLSAPLVIAGTGTLAINGGNFTISAGTSGTFTNTGDAAMIYITGGTVTLEGVTLDANSKTRVLQVSGASSLLNINANTIIKGGQTSGTGSVGGGGGVRVTAGADVVMAGGEISGNNASGWGGAVHITAIGSKFTMSGGILTGNSSDTGCGGIDLAQNGAFEMSGGAITDNTGASGGIDIGGGCTVTIDNGSAINITGNKTASNTPNNVYLTNTETIILNGAPASGSTIGVTHYSWPVVGAAVDAVSVGTYTNLALADLPFFHSDDESKAIMIYDGTSGSEKLRLANYTKVYVSTTGSDATGNGTFALPYATLQTAYNAVMSGGEVCVLDDLTATTNLSANKNKAVTIQSYDTATGQTPETANPHTVTRGAATGTMLNISAGTVTLENIIFDGAGSNVTTGVVGYGGAAASITNATLIMEDGAVFQNHKSSVSAGGSYTTSGVSLLSNGIFTMNGGEIKDNDSGTAYVQSAGVYVASGSNGTFTMNGGKITGNVGGRSGGVFNSGGTFILNAGEISGNSGKNNPGHAGGVGGALTLGTGEIVIEDNTTNGVPCDVVVNPAVPITLKGALNANTTIGVTPHYWPDAVGDKALIAQGATSPAYTATAADMAKFFSNRPEKAGVRRESDAKIYLAFIERAGVGVDNTTGSGYVAVPASNSGSYTLIGPDSYSETITVGPNGLTFDGLTPGGTYTLAPALDGSASEAFTVPAVDTNVYAAADGTEITVYPADPNASYAIATPDGNIVGGTSWIDGDPGPVTFTGLSADTDYIIVALPASDVSAPVSGLNSNPSKVPVHTPAAFTDITPADVTRNPADTITIDMPTTGQEYAVIDPTTGEVVAGWGGGPFDDLDPNKPYKVVTRVPGGLPGKGVTLLNGLSNSAKNNVTGDDTSITIDPSDANLWYAIVDSTGAIVNLDSGTDWRNDSPAGGPITWSSLSPSTEYSIVTFPKTGSAAPANVTEPIAGGTPVVTAPAAVTPVARTDNGGKDQLEFDTEASVEYAIVKKGANPENATWFTGGVASTGYIVDGDGKSLGYTVAGTSNNPATVTGLDPNAEYEVLVRVKTPTPPVGAIVLNGVTSAPPDASAYLDPTDPTHGHMTVVNAASADLSGNDYILVGPDGIVKEIKLGGSTDIDFTSNLLPGQEYTVHVVSTGTGGVTVGTDTGSTPVTGGTTVTRRVPVGDTSVGGSIAATPTSITINPTSTGVQYNLVNSSGDVVGTWKPGTGGPITFSGLTAGEKYEIVTELAGATPSAGSGAYIGKGMTVSTPAEAAAIVADDIEREKDGSRDKITLDSKTGQEYQLLDSSGNPVGPWISGTGSDIVWDDLDPNMAYTIVSRTAADPLASPPTDASLPTAGINVPKISKPSGGYGGGVPTPSNNATINSGTGGKVTVSPTNPAKNDNVTITVTPNNGYELDKLTITDANGNTIYFIDNGDGTYTYIQPDGKVTINATFKAVKVDDGDDNTDDADVSALLNTDDHIAYVSGRGDGMFEPNTDMSRAEVAQMFYNLLRNKNVRVTASFNDVSSNAWYADAVGALASLGILTGFPDGGFHPTEKITRAQFAAIAVRFATISQGSVRFNDVPSTHWAYEYINTAANFGWVTGVGDNSFEPDREITRAEAVTLVNRMLGRSADKAYIDANTGSLITFTDVASTHWAYYNIMEAANGHDYEIIGYGEIWN